MALPKRSHSEVERKAVVDRKRRRQQSMMWLKTLAMLAFTLGRFRTFAAMPRDRSVPRYMLRGDAKSRMLSNFLEKRTAANDFRGPELVKEGASTEYSIMGQNFQVDGIGTEQYQYCYDTLASVAVDGRVCYEQYCEFLDLLSGGEVSNCRNLDSFWVGLFYSTACGYKQYCSHDKAYISTRDEGLNSWNLYLLCEEAMSNTFTHVDVSFEFSIQYNSSLLDKNEIAACVSDATENLLYDSFGCVDNESRRLHNLRSGANHDGLDVLRPATTEGPGSLGETGVGDRRRRVALLQDAFGTPDEWSRKNCPFSVTTEVVVVDLVCSNFLPSQSSNETKCGLVQTTVKVKVPKIVQPSEDALYQDVTETLRESINSGTFPDYFPPECRLTS